MRSRHAPWRRYAVAAVVALTMSSLVIQPLSAGTIDEPSDREAEGYSVIIDGFVRVSTTYERRGHQNLQEGEDPDSMVAVTTWKPVNSMARQDDCTVQARAESPYTQPSSAGSIDVKAWVAVVVPSACTGSVTWRGYLHVWKYSQGSFRWVWKDRTLSQTTTPGEGGYLGEREQLRYRCRTTASTSWKSSTTVGSGVTRTVGCRD